MFYCYESFTSSLKVWAERSPLSAWTETNIVKKLRFQIIFNRNQAKSLVIRGNQTQLESLITGIASYVDSLLNSNLNQSFNQDFELKLSHRIDIPNLGKFSRLEFSTLELFDLSTNLELLTNEIEIFPVLVPNLNPVNSSNLFWLKVAAAAIASVGVTVGITTGTFKLLQPESPQYVVVTSNSTANSIDSNSEQKSLPKSNNFQNPTQPEIKPQKPQVLGKDKVQPPIPAENSTNKLTPKTPVAAPQTPPKSSTTQILKTPSEIAPNSVPTKIPKPTTQVPAPIADSFIPKTSTQPSITTNSNRVNPRQETPEIDPKNAGEGIIKTTPETSLRTPLGILETPQALNQNLGRATERRDSDRLSSRASKNQTTNQNGNENISKNSDESSGLNSKEQNLKLTVLKIESSVNSQDLEVYKTKIESLSLSSTKLAPLINTEIKITVVWQNRQITEVKIIPESMELNYLIRRSLFETLTEQDGNIEITVKVNAP